MLSLEPGQSFAHRYTIVRLLGSGGMGTVYHAWDSVLGDAVALKLIRVHLGTPAADVGDLHDRFKRELKLARHVSHPNVIRIHDLGEVDGTLYLTMEYVAGVDLAALLEQQAPLPTERAIALVRQVAAGLAAAHRAGVVHRDLKPANVLVGADDHALLMDFGIARSTSAVTVHTVPGAIVGTIAYMAPEQLRGEVADERSDVYALGLILYELLAGRRARSDHGLVDAMARLGKAPPSLKSVVPGVPDTVARIVAKCLQVDPGARYADAAELSIDLEALQPTGHVRTSPRSGRLRRMAIASALAAVLLAVVLLAAGMWPPWVPSTPANVTQRPPISVLIADFDNRAGDPVFDGSLEQALGIAIEEAPFIASYSRQDATALVHDLRIGSKLDARAAGLIATREGIPFVLAGAITRQSDGYGIEVRVLEADAPEREPRKAAAHASGKAGVLAAVSDVAAQLRVELGDAAPSRRQQAETFTATSLEAVREYIIANDLAADQKDADAVVHFRRAISHDPEFARAYAGLAMSLHYLGQRQEAARQWKEALTRMDRMSRREQLRTSGVYYASVVGDYRKAIESFDALVKEYPADSAGHNNLAVAHFSVLDFREALAQGRTAIQMFPHSLKYRANYALYAMYAGDFAAAASTARAVLQEDASMEVAYLPLAMAALASGKADEARAVYDRGTAAGVNAKSVASAGLADLAMYEARYEEAIAILEPAIEGDLAQKNAVAANAKLVALASAQGTLGLSQRAARTMARAIALDTGEDSTLVTAARLAVEAGRFAQAQELATALAGRLPAQSRAYAKMIEGEIALASRKYPAAIAHLHDARAFADLWLIRYVLGRAYFQRGDYLAASSEFEVCRARKGEATALFLDDWPTFRYYATVPYWLGRSLESQQRRAAEYYREFLAIRGASGADSEVVDARTRLALESKAVTPD